MNKSQESLQSIYRLEISLVELEPEIWRSADVPSSFTLEELHSVIQILMDWDDAHLWNFIVENLEYSHPNFVKNFHGSVMHKDARNIKLSDALKQPKDSIEYTYDFGDNWEHNIVLEKIMKPNSEWFYPVCIDGEYSAPPDDCGGPIGYCDMMKILDNPEDEDYESVKEWLGEEFNPYHFDLKAINTKLQKEHSGNRN